MEQSIEEQSSKLQEILKQSLQQSVALARRRIRSKKGISELQTVLIDYRQNQELAGIILEVIRLISHYELSRQQQAEEVKQIMTLEQYHNLQASLQKFEGSVREHIKNEQQLKIYCDDLQQKNRELQKSNEELLKSTKQMITNLKRDNQRLIEQNAGLMNKLKERELKGSQIKQKEQPLINSIKKARKLIQSFQGSKTSREESVAISSNFGQRLQQSAKGKRSSLSSIRINK